ncbi:hypothetical protein [Chelatococcus sp.]|uniref:hypothetical protein n=1 Tax=Chelatococcus sp. TaxID=1953771 RepID=UPI0025BED2A6|nr:hypothetical protein [Chelatococcus sp.]MBX3560149.1 hypothetical protein [Chelatococcus sp.]
MTNTSNLYRKARALVMKTVTAGCTPHEHVAATNLAVSIIAKHGLDAARIDWPAPPPGFAWSGEPGRSEVVERRIEPTAKPTRKGKASTAKTGTDSTKPKRQTVGERLLAMLQRRNGATLDCQRRSESGPAGRSKSRPLRGWREPLVSAPCNSAVASERPLALED